MELNFGLFLDFHRDGRSGATRCVREYEMQVPYGVVKTEKQRMVGLEEKPVRQYFVNADIYVLEPNTLDLIPDDTFFDMPDLFEALIDRDQAATVRPVREYWQDVGQKDDLHRANRGYADVFGER